MISNGAKAIISASFAVLSWSTVATAFKLALEHLTHFELLLVASSTSLLIFAIILTFQHRWKSLIGISIGKFGYFALLGLLNPVLYYLVLFKSYSLLPAQIAQPINYMWPIFLTVFLAIFAHQPIPNRKYIGLIISLCGLIIISIGSSKIGHFDVSGVGIFFAALSAVLWSVYWMVTNCNNGKTDAYVALFICFLFGTIYLLIMACFLGIHTFTTIGILSGMYVGCFEMGIPFVAFGYAISKTDNPALINQMCYLSPFMSLFFISVILHEPIVMTTYLGLGMIVAGIIFNQYAIKSKTY